MHIFTFNHYHNSASSCYGHYFAWPLLSYVYVHLFIFTGNSISSYGFVFLPIVFYFNLKDSLWCFLLVKCNGNTLLWMLFVWQCLNFNFLKTVLSYIKFLVHFYILLTLSMSFHYFLSFMDSNEKSIVNVMRIPT